MLFSRNIYVTGVCYEKVHVRNELHQYTPPVCPVQPNSVCFVNFSIVRYWMSNNIASSKDKIKDNRHKLHSVTRERSETEAVVYSKSSEGTVCHQILILLVWRSSTPFKGNEVRYAFSKIKM